MKKSLILIALSVLFITACSVKVSDKHKQEKHSEETNKDGKEYTSDYICPMHCEGSGSDSAGTCPVCKMDLVKNEKE